MSREQFKPVRFSKIFLEVIEKLYCYCVMFIIDVTTVLIFDAAYRLISFVYLS